MSMISDIYQLGLYQGAERDTTSPTRQAITYNRTTGRWEHAPSVMSYSKPVTQVSNLVKASTRQVMNRHASGGGR
jgi:hypothetical protein